MLIAVLQFLNVVSIGLALAIDRSYLPDNMEDDVVQVVAGAAIVLLGVVTVVGLWTLQRWAWAATMVWVGIGMAWALHSYFEDDPNYSTMVLSLAQVFYLNQREVQRAFLGGRAEAAGGGHAWS
jgi:hypothetical protein